MDGWMSGDGVDARGNGDNNSDGSMETRLDVCVRVTTKKITQVEDVASRGITAAEGSSSSETSRIIV